MSELKIASGDFAVHSAKRILGWVFAWTAAMVVADKAELYQWYSSTSISIASVVIYAVLGLGTMVTFTRYIRSLSTSGVGMADGGGINRSDRDVEIDKASKMGIGMVMGTLLGMIIGTVSGHMGLSITFGIIAGIIFGAITVNLPKR